MANALVIVESPAKARTISKYLGAGYIVESSVGHIRDLPASAGEIPKKYKTESWARLGINVEDDFKPLYVVSRKKQPTIRHLSSLLAEVDELYLATDGDREGEAIAWHLVEILKPKVPVKRMVFHEITKNAILEAVSSPRDIDRRLVDAQEGRRLLDRLYGYEVSPVLWKKVMPRLSAGRVQSVATRVVVHRERERMLFVKAPYWSITGTFTLDNSVTGNTGNSGNSDSSGNADNTTANADIQGDIAFKARLSTVDGKRLATGKNFNSNGELVASTETEYVHLNKVAAFKLVEELSDASFVVQSRQNKPYRRRPAPPFITSTFQQEASRKLGMSSAVAMRVAQALYEDGLITYMRTDSTTLSPTAVDRVRESVRSLYGQKYVTAKPRVYKKQVKNAQEAHEAIRPAGDVVQSPSEVAKKVHTAHARVYQLIWQRTLASQMTDCVGETAQIGVGAVSASGSEVEFSASGTVITHSGFRAVYTTHLEGVHLKIGGRAGSGVGGRAGSGSEPLDTGTETMASAVSVGSTDGVAGVAADVDDTEDGDNSADAFGVERKLPPLTVGDHLKSLSLDPKGHETQPPARYTEASLVKRLEELGVGRPSTYASIMRTIVDREYAWKKGSALVPSFTAFSVTNLLELHFPQMVDYAFTAEMEEDLDKIARGEEQTVPWLSRFYFGDGHAPGLKEKVTKRLPDIDAREVNTVSIGTDKTGAAIVVRVGRYGPYLQRGEEVASMPSNIEPDTLKFERAVELLATPRDERVLGVDPVSGLDVWVKAGHFGPYVQLGSTEDQQKKPKTASKQKKPKTASLFKNMTIETVTLKDGLRLLSLPRVVGKAPVDDIEITAQNGRYGPYIKKGSETRSLESEELIFTITLEECITLLSQPKQYKRAATQRQLKELGEDIETGKQVVMKEGRFGLYVTDGDVNASLRKSDTAETITIERASELLAIRRAASPAKATVKQRNTAKRSVAKKTTAATKRPAAKRTTAATKRSAAKRTATKAAKKSTATAKRTATKAAKKSTATAKRTATKKLATKAKQTVKAPRTPSTKLSENSYAPEN